MISEFMYLYFNNKYKNKIITTGQLTVKTKLQPRCKSQLMKANLQKNSNEAIESKTVLCFK